MAPAPIQPFFRPPRPTPPQALPLAPAFQHSAHGPLRLATLLLAALLLLACASTAYAQIAVNTSGAQPNASGSHAMLDITDPVKGLLAPRMTQNQRVNMLSGQPNTAAARDGLLVYQTDSVVQDPRGYYYYDFSTPIPGWRHIAWPSKVWALGGNAGTTNADFLGTLNATPLIFRTNNQERGRLNPNGDLQLYFTTPVTAPNERVEVEGGIKLTGGSITDTPGNIRFTPAAGGIPAKFEGYVANAAPAPTGWRPIDNNFGERKMQDAPAGGPGCGDPSSPTAPEGSPRPWPIPGPGGPYGSLGGPQSPYYTVWEDGHRQYLYLAEDLAIAGICPGAGNPIRAIAFNVTSVGGGAGHIHFLRFSMKNTFTNNAAVFDMAGLTTFAMPNPPELPANATQDVRYAPGHLTGYTVTTGWNVHAWDQGGIGGFVWGGGNLLIDAALDDQDWTAPSIRSGSVQSYNTSYQSMISMYCDGCGGNGPNTCLWQTAPPAGYYFPPTTPTNGAEAPPTPSSTNEGWGWKGGWNLVEGVDTRACDGSATDWQGGGPPSVAQQLPRVAFLCQYVGSGSAVNTNRYMFAQEGVMIGDAGWATSGTFPNNPFRGPGTITAQKSIWSNTSLLSDYVFDLYYDGKAKPEDAVGASTYQRLPLQELPNYVERQRRLPTIDGRNTWNRTGGFSVDKLTNQLWVTVEDQALYIKELNQRMDALQQYLVDKKLKEIGGEGK